MAQLLRQRALNEKSIVGTALLPGRALLRRQRSRVNLLLLLGVTGLALRRLGRLLHRLHGVADTGGEIGTERLERLGERHELGLRRDNRRGHNRHDGRGGNRGHRGLRLRGRGDLGDLGLGGLRLSGLGGSRRGSGDDNGGGGIRLLGGGHLV